MKLAAYVLLVLTIVLGGCAGAPSASQKVALKEARLYQLYIDDSGHLLDPLTGEVVDNEQGYLDDIFDNWQHLRGGQSDMEFSIFIHGGLNTFSSATENVDRVKDEILASGKYPLFISWNSSYTSNYLDHLFLLRRGEVEPLLGPASMPFVLLEDLLRSIARLPASTYNVLFDQNTLIIEYYSSTEEASDKALCHLEEQGLFNIHNSPNDRGHGLSDYYTVWNPVKLVSAPLVDGLGTGAWNSMLRRTDLVLRTNDSFNGDSQASSDTAVTQFFNYYARHYSAVPMELIGHSMGSIIANNIISKYPQLHFQNIVYLAAACRIKDLEHVVAPYLERHPSAHFYNVTLNPYRDIAENNGYDFIPRGSLLMWIDQTLGDTNSFQDRTAGFWFNIVRAADQTFSEPKVKRRVHLTQFGIRDGTPQKHGEFKGYRFWTNEFWVGEVPGMTVREHAENAPNACPDS